MRFAEYTDEWHKFALSDFVTRITRRNKNNESSLPLTISAQYGLVDQITFFNKTVASVDLSGYYLLYNGDFAYNKSYSNDYAWGAVKRLDKYEKGCLSSLYFVFRPTDKVDSDYLTHYFETNKWHKGISDIAGEGARNHGLLNMSVDDYFAMDKLLEADIYYTTQAYSSSWAAFVGESESFGEKADKYAYLKYTDKVEHTGGGLFAGTYKWDRIQTVEDFIANENKDNIYHGAIIDVNYATKLTDAAMNELKGKKWVLRFAETDYSFWSGQSSYGSFATIVGDVTILRLKFETDGITYNLGVIDNKQSGGKEPSNETDIDISLNDRGKTILYLLLLILLLVLLAPILPYILQAIVWVISLPIKGISAIGKSAKRKRQERKERKIYEKVVATIDEPDYDYDDYD